MFLLVCGVLLVSGFGMAPLRTPRIDWGAVVAQSLYSSGIANKAAWRDMGWNDGGAAWSAGLKGRPGYSLDLWRLDALPLKFWLTFLELAAVAVARAWMDDLLQPVKELTDDIRLSDGASGDVDVRADDLDAVGRARPARVSVAGPEAVGAGDGLRVRDRVGRLDAHAVRR